MPPRVPRKPSSIIDREAEWRELAGLCKTYRPELVVERRNLQARPV